MNNYKGIFYNEDPQKHYYEGGAHFKYKHLVKALKELKAKREEEENELKLHSRNKSLDLYQDKNINNNNNLLTLDTNNNYNNNLFESPTNKREKKDAYIEQLLSIDKLKHSKKHKIKLKEIKTEHKPKVLGALYTENNRYSNDNEPIIRNSSMDLHLHNLRDRNDDEYRNIKLLSEDKKMKNIFNMKLSSKNLEKLPKIQSLYYNNLSKKNVLENISNSNMATNSTNIKGELNDPIYNKLEYEINKTLNKPDFFIFSHKKKLPHISGKSLSIINNNDKPNNLLDKNKLKFTANNRNNKEDLTISHTNNIKSFNINENNNDEDDKDYIIKNINLKKSNFKIFKLSNKENENNIELKSKLMGDSEKKRSHKKSTQKRRKKKDNESDE
jgi:hypothetical protein